MTLTLQATRRIDEWYADNGIFGGVKEDINMRKKSLTTGEYIFEVEELEVGDVRLRFVDKKGNEMQVCTCAWCNCSKMTPVIIRASHRLHNLSRLTHYKRCGLHLVYLGTHKNRPVAAVYPH